MPIPNIPWPPTPPGGGVVPARTEINAAAESSTAQTRNATVLAAGQRIPLIYGETTIGARADIWLVHNNYLLMRCLVGHGPIAAVVSVSSEGDALPAGVEYTTYLGFPGQGIDPWLAAAFAAQAPASPYVDTLPGIAYTVFRVPVGALAGLPQFKLRVRGRLLYDPRPGTIAYTDNAALALADALASATYGANLTVDWDSVTTVANRCDDLVGPSGTQEKRRIIGLAITERVRARDLFSALRFYAGCWIDRSGPAVRLVADAPAAPVMTFDAGHIVAGSMRTRRGSILDAVSEVRATYTEPAKDWADEVAVWEDPGIALGTVERMTATLKTPGISRHSQAVRECLERRNKLMLCDFEARWTAFDVALKVRKYDVVDVQVDAATLKRMRVMDMVPKSPGRWEMLASEYDPAVWSDAVATAPTYPDSAYPSPMVLPAVSGLALAEEFFQTAEGFTASRLVASWTPLVFDLLRGYRVEMWSGETLIAASEPLLPVWRSERLVRAVSYAVKVQALSRWGAGPWSGWALLTALGKDMRPTDVDSVWGFEVGGEVRLQNSPAIDIDERRYEYRWGAVGVAWDAAALIDRVDGLRLNVKTIPVGTWDFLVKALDSVRTEAEPYGQYSLNAARCTITVTRDTDAYLDDAHDFFSPTVTGMVESNVRRSDSVRRFVTSDGAPAADVFVGALSAYPNIAATYHGAVDSALVSEAVDFGTLLAGNWHGETDAVALSGSLSEHIELSPDAGTYTSYGIDAKAAGRFARLRVTATGSATLVVPVPALALRVDATPRTQYIEGVTLAAGGLLIAMSSPVVKFLSINPIVIGSSGAVAWRADALTTGDPASFLLYAFDSATQDQISTTFKGEVRYV